MSMRWWLWFARRLRARHRGERTRPGGIASRQARGPSKRALSCLCLEVLEDRTIPSTATIGTIAGNGTLRYSGDGGPATAAELYSPNGVAVDAAGDVFIADSGNNVVREVNAKTGVISTVAGDGTLGYSGDGGPATAAELDITSGLAVDAAGDIFIPDSDDNVVREVNASTGLISTAAGDGTGTAGYSGDGGLATAAELNAPSRVALDAAGDLFIADTGNNVIREVNAQTGLISTIAGTGTVGSSGNGGLATAAELDLPIGIAVDAAGDVFIADTNNGVIREVNAQTGIISTVAGNGKVGYSGDGGPATSAAVDATSDLTVDSAGDLFIVDQVDNVIREVNAKTGIISTVAGNGATGYSGDGGLASAAELNEPNGVAIDAAGDIYIADSGNNVIREVNAKTGLISTIAGDGNLGFSGPATAAALDASSDLAVDAAGNIFIADQNDNVVREVDVRTGVISVIAGNGKPGYSGDGGPATAAELDFPTGVAVDAAGDVFIADSGNNVIREINAQTGIISTIAGNGNAGYSGDGGPATAAELDFPYGVAVDAAGDVFIADSDNNVIREINAQTGIIDTIAGNGKPGYSGDGGPATAAELNFPYGVAADSAGDVFVVDYSNNVIREVNAKTGIISTIAGNGSTDYSGDGGPATSAALNYPTGVAVDSAGDVFIADSGNNVVREVNAQTGVIGTIAGTGTPGYSGDGGPPAAAELDYPSGVAVDSAGDVFIADTANSVVREVDVGVVVLGALSQTQTTAGVNYIGSIAIVGGTRSYTVSVPLGLTQTSDGVYNGLPPGLTMSSTGVLSGIPQFPGIFQFTVRAFDSAGATTTQTFTLTVNPPLQITTRQLPNGTLNTAYRQSLNAVGGTTPLAWSVLGSSLAVLTVSSASPLPPGLTLGTSGVLSGTPTTAGTFSFFVMAQDAAGAGGYSAYSITVPPQAISPANLSASSQAVNALAGTAFSGAVATFTDSTGNTNPEDYTASIAWGDGNTSTGTVDALAGGGFSVSGTNTYASSGVYPVTVVIVSSDGGAATSNGLAAVAPAIPANQSDTPTATLLAPAVSSLDASEMTPYEFDLAFQDEGLVAGNTLAGSTLQVQPPEGAALNATAISTVLMGSQDGSGDASTILVTYQITPPGDNWFTAPPGIYTVVLGGSPVTDLAGDAVEQGSVGIFLVDTAPSLSVSPDEGLNPANGAQLSNSSSLVLSGRAQASSIVNVYSGTTLLGTPTAGSDGSWTYMYSAPGDGTYDFTVTASDSSGNTSAPSANALVEVDTTPPTSTVLALLANSMTTFTVSWTGQDNAGGPGLAYFDVYDSDNGGAWTLWQNQTTQTSAVFNGQIGHSYAFYSLATDIAGNVEVETPHAEAQTQTPVLLTALSESENTTAPPSIKISTMLGSHYHDAEPNGNPGIAVFVASGTGNWQYSNGSSWVNITGVSVGSALLLPGKDSLRFLPAALWNGAADLLYVAWNGSLGTNGGRANVATLGGGTPFSGGDAMVAVTVTYAAHAPGWTTTSATLAPVEPGTENPAGETVQRAFGGLFVDPNPSQPAGIAVTAVTGVSGGGTWQYALYDSATQTVGAFQNLPKVSPVAALLLGSRDLIRFVPANSGFIGMVSLQVHAWDGSSGTDGGIANLSKSGSTGGTTAFSSAVLTGKLYFNNAPTLNPPAGGITLPSIAENTTSKAVSAATLLKDARSADVDKGASLGLAIVAAGGPGTWQYLLSGGSWQAVPATVSVSSALLLPVGALLRFVPAVNQSGSATLSWDAWDGTQGAAGAQGFVITGSGGATAFSGTSATATLTIAPSKLAPAPAWSGSGAALTPVVPNTTPAGDAVASVFAAYFEDPGVSVGIAVSGVTGTASGQWQYSLDGGTIWVSLNLSSPKQAILLAADDLIRFVPKSGFLGTATLTAHAWDGNPSLHGSSANLSISGKTGGTTDFSGGTLIATCLVNDAPTLSP